MLLSLAKIIDCPGASVPFDETLDFSGMEFGSQAPVTESVHASGTVRNTAGVMILTGEVHTRLHCVCDRCARPFERDFSLPLRAVLTAKLESEENEDEELFELVGDSVDLDDVINTAFVLNTEQKFLCKEDCKGLCPTCGADLNEGPCGCRAEADPRLAALQQWLEKK